MRSDEWALLMAIWTTWVLWLACQAVITIQQMIKDKRAQKAKSGKEID